MRFDPALLDEIRARLPVSDVVARHVRLKRQGREFIGLSPFKSEKTPSFTVNDQKGFYHCFASGEHGDIFTFLMKKEGLSFPEAVERLAGEAGVSLPKPTAHDQENAKHRSRIYEIMAAAKNFFQEALQMAEAREARTYLEKRGLSPEVQQTFEIGYAKNNRFALKEHLASLGFTPEEMVDSGLLIAGEDIPVSYDRFRHRIIFPIHDLKGRPVAFGGRALDPGQPAKYLNSPETQTFHKGHMLFNAHRARQAAFDKRELIAVEGYMDVIALHSVGIEWTVAPLGTALTEAQIQALWKMSHEPVLCFDGDSAGRKAAERAVETVLPLLKPGHSLRFAFLPDGTDPDDLVRSEGANAFKDVIAKAKPLVDVLWAKSWGTGDWDTPERRAAFEQDIFGQIERIADQKVGTYYKDEIKQRLFETWKQIRQNGKKSGTGAAGRPNFPNSFNRQDWRARTINKRSSSSSKYKTRFHIEEKGRPTDSLRQSSLARQERSRLSKTEALILKTVLNHPWLLDDYSEEIAELNFENRDLKSLRDAMLECHILQNSLDTEQLHTQLTEKGLSQCLGQLEYAITHDSDGFVKPDADKEQVEQGWLHILTRHRSVLALKSELILAEQAFHNEQNEDNFRRLKQVRLELSNLDNPDLAQPEDGRHA